MERGIPDKGPGGWGRRGRHEGTEDLFLIAFSQEIEVGLKLPDSQADSQPPFAGFRSRLATIQPVFHD